METVFLFQMLLVETVMEIIVAIYLIVTILVTKVTFLVTTLTVRLSKLVLAMSKHSFQFKLRKYCIFTARIRRMGEGTVFSLFVSSHLGGGGDTPVRSGGEGEGGTPPQV